MSTSCSEEVICSSSQSADVRFCSKTNKVSKNKKHPLAKAKIGKVE